MSPYQSRDQAAQLFQELFLTLQKDHGLSEGLQEKELTLRLRHTDPDIDIFVGPGEVVCDQPGRKGVITFRMAVCDAHDIWSGRLSLAAALGTGRLTVQGHIPKVLQLVQLILPAFTHYPGLAARAGVV